MIGELSLRAARRRLGNKITAPSMVLDDGTWLTDSWQIACWIDNEVGGQFFRGATAEVSRLNTETERFLQIFRPVVLERMVNDYPLALEENLPRMFPKALHRPLRSVGGMGVKFLIQKYERPSIDRAEVTGLLDSFRRSIGEKPTVLEAGFSYADILIATALQMVQPVSRKYWSIGPATREAWTLHEYINEAGELLQWRDELFDAYRLKRRDELEGAETAARTSA